MSVRAYFYATTHLSWCDRLNPASIVRIVVEMGTGDAECLSAVSSKMLGMNEGTSYGNAFTNEVMPSTAESRPA